VSLLAVAMRAFFGDIGRLLFVRYALRSTTATSRG
jgi:hypothetical protein